MFLLHLLLVVLAVLDVTHGMAIHEKIDPVDLAYHCIHVLTDGEEHDKSPIVLMHGLGGSYKNWDGVNQVLALRTKRRVCAVDLRNHGDSPWNNRTDVAALVADLDHFLDQQKIKKVNLIGHSLGGKTAVHFTLNNPDRVDSIVVEDMRPNGATEAGMLIVQSFLDLLKAALNAIPEGTTEEETRRSILDYINEALKKIGSPERLEEKDVKMIELRKVDGKWKLKWNIDVLSKATKDIKNYLTESSGLYTGPAMFIYGAKSPFAVGEDKDNILKLFPNAKLEPVKEASHVIHGKFPQFDDAVIKFINEVK